GRKRTRTEWTWFRGSRALKSKRPHERPNNMGVTCAGDQRAGPSRRPRRQPALVHGAATRNHELYAPREALRLHTFCYLLRTKSEPLLSSSAARVTPTWMMQMESEPNRVIASLA